MLKIDLTEIEGSTSYLFQEWLKNSKIEKYCKENGLEKTKAAILEDIANLSPKGKESNAYQLNEKIFAEKRSLKSLMLYIANSMFGGAGLGVKK